MAQVLQIHITRAKCMLFHKKRKHRAIRARRKETRALYVLSARLFYNRSTVEPRYNEGPRDRQPFFAITRFRYIEVLFHIFNYNCTTRRKENRLFYWGLRYIEVHNVEVWSWKFIVWSLLIHKYISVRKLNCVFSLQKLNYRYKH